jgi:hypothetical protein
MCARCGEPRCAQHYHVSVWWDGDRAHNWIAQLPTGTQAQSWLKGVNFGDSSFPKAYAAGGPGCVPCRTRAAEEAAARIGPTCSTFASTPTAAGLRTIAAGADVVTAEQLQMIASGLRRCAPATAALVELRMTPPPRKTFGKSYRTLDATVREVSRRPVAWFAEQSVAVDTDRRIWVDARKIWVGEGRDRVSGPSPLCVVGTDEAARAGFVEGSPGGWGNDPQPDRYELTIGVPVMELRPAEGRFAYAQATPIARLFGSLADRLK